MVVYVSVSCSSVAAFLCNVAAHNGIEECNSVGGCSIQDNLRCNVLTGARQQLLSNKLSNKGFI